MIIFQRDVIVAVNHFYFCLLAAILLREKYYPKEKASDRKKYIKLWLMNANKNKTFSQFVFPEVQWLQEELSQLSVCYNHFVVTVEHVYRVSLNYIND
ncbi:hypothetical protein U4M36_25975 [Klebsiella pneumoniae]|nr:hypothetical protein [Klebsiella pneumoniae]